MDYNGFKLVGEGARPISDDLGLFTIRDAVASVRLGRMNTYFDGQRRGAKPLSLSNLTVSSTRPLKPSASKRRLEMADLS